MRLQQPCNGNSFGGCDLPLGDSIQDNADGTESVLGILQVGQSKLDSPFSFDWYQAAKTKPCYSAGLSESKNQI